jgi:predicted DNA-binding transcriptional regulator AlpA
MTAGVVRQHIDAVTFASLAKIGRSTLIRYVSAGKAPKPVGKYGGRNWWRLADCEEFIASPTCAEIRRVEAAARISRSTVPPADQDLALSIVARGEDLTSAEIAERAGVPRKRIAAALLAMRGDAVLPGAMRQCTVTGRPAMTWSTP